MAAHGRAPSKVPSPLEHDLGKLDPDTRMMLDKYQVDYHIMQQFSVEIYDPPGPGRQVDNQG